MFTTIFKIGNSNFPKVEILISKFYLLTGRFRAIGTVRRRIPLSDVYLAPCCKMKKKKNQDKLYLLKNRENNSKINLNVPWKLNIFHFLQCKN